MELHSPPRSNRTTGRPSCRPRCGTPTGVLHNLATDAWTYISLGYFSPDPGGRATGCLDDAAQDQPDPLRERRGEPRALEQALATCSRHARDLAPARDLTDSTRSATSASPSGTRCSRWTTSSAASVRSTLGRDAAAGRPRRKLGGARRGDSDSHPRRGRRSSSRSPTPIAVAQGAHPRQASAQTSSPRSSGGSTSGTRRSSGCSLSPPARPTRASRPTSSTGSDPSSRARGGSPAVEERRAYRGPSPRHVAWSAPLVLARRAPKWAQRRSSQGADAALAAAPSGGR